MGQESDDAPLRCGAGENSHFQFVRTRAQRPKFDWTSPIHVTVKLLSLRSSTLPTRVTNGPDERSG
jgi:hypothetical protein